jgi:hypothetical protein
LSIPPCPFSFGKGVSRPCQVHGKLFSKSLQTTSPLAYPMYSKALLCKPSTLSCSFCLSRPCSGRRRSVEHLAGARSTCPSQADRAPPHPNRSQRPCLAFLYLLAQHRLLSLSFPLVSCAAHSGLWATGIAAHGPVHPVYRAPPPRPF